MSVISDKKLPEETGAPDDLADYYEPELLSASDYYPFGMQMPGRNYMAEGYRFGFNGKEKDDNNEWGNLTHYDYGFRIHNPALGRFLSVDPLASSYPMLTPYQFAGNGPIMNIDLDGLEPRAKIRGDEQEGQKTSTADIVPTGSGWTPRRKEWYYYSGGLEKYDEGYYSKEEYEGIVSDIATLHGRATGLMEDPLNFVEQNFDLSNCLDVDCLPSDWTSEFGDVYKSSFSQAYSDALNARTGRIDYSNIEFDIITLLQGGFLLRRGALMAKGVATKGVARSLDDLSSIKGATWDEAKSLIPKDWISGPMKKGEGIKFVSPAKKGEQILLEKGWPGAKDPLHAGPYMKISRDGQITRIPLQGNPTLK